MASVNRREMLKGAGAAWAFAQGGWGAVKLFAEELPHARPPKSKRHFTSEAVEALIPRVQSQIGDPALAETGRPFALRPPIIFEMGR